jgi:DNA-binding NarL/FixJ family response regulator
MFPTRELSAARASLGAAHNRLDLNPLPGWATVMLVGGQTIFRRGLRELLEQAGFVVFGEAADCEQALELLTGRPRVAVVDIDHTDGVGVEDVARLAKADPTLSILVLSAFVSDEEVAASIAAGACGYLLKTVSPDELVLDIQAAAAGRTLILPRSTAAMLHREAARAGESPQELSARENEVLRLLAKGLDNASIAAALFISPSTAKTHVSHILRKLRSENRIQAAVYAAKSGLL